MFGSPKQRRKNFGPAKSYTHHSLKTGVELYEEWGLERHRKHSLLHHRALNVVVLVVGGGHHDDHCSGGGGGHDDD